MSDTSAFGFGQFVPGFDFLQNLSKTAAQAQPSAAAGMPGMASWVAPTLSIEDIDCLIPHQPSIQILRKTAEAIGLPFEKVMTNMDRYANTGGGTIPILLDEVNRSGRLTAGKHVLLAAVGAGWTWGAAIIKWC